MTKEEYKLLSVDDFITGEVLKPIMGDGTLLYGYTFDRETYHVYLKDGEIHAIKYHGWEPENAREVLIDSNFDYARCKRLYPERCNYVFCNMLQARDVKLPFTFWTEDIPEEQFYGHTLETWKEKAYKAFCENYCYGNYIDAYRHNDLYIVHSELEIVCFDSQFEELWSFSGRDIFVNVDTESKDVRIADEGVWAVDWLGNTYLMGYDGTMVQENIVQE